MDLATCPRQAVELLAQSGHVAREARRLGGWDQAAFEAHLASEHSLAFNAEIAAHILGGASTLVWLERGTRGRGSPPHDIRPPLRRT